MDQFHQIGDEPLVDTLNPNFSIYEDELADFRPAGVSSTNIFDDAYFADALRPVTEAVNNSSFIMEPPPRPTISVSPTKKPSPQSSPRVDLKTSVFESISFKPPARPFVTDSPPKRSNMAPSYQRIASKSQQPLFSSFPSTQPTEHVATNANTSFNHSGTSNNNQFTAKTSYTSVLGKRPNQEKTNAAQQQLDRISKMNKVDDSEANEPLPAPEDMPPVVDDPEGNKPPYSYATMIGMALLRAPHRKLTLAQIYEFIKTNFKFYQNHQSGWNNSIRHNLSINKYFEKTERPKDDPGKGSYWRIIPGAEQQFYRDRNARRGPAMDLGGLFEPIYSDNVRPSTAPSMGTFALPAKGTTYSQPVDSTAFLPDNEISSDATIPASDPLGPEQTTIAPAKTGPVYSIAETTELLSSPPPVDLHSSPPVPLKSTKRSTPPPPPIGHFRANSRSRSGAQKARKLDAFRDSGFYSSIESSSAPRKNTYQPHGHANPERRAAHSGLKRGSAEEEIARMRSSSFDPSPIKSKPRLKPPPAVPMNSSPLRFTPLTPIIKVRPPKHGPATVSPNTYLRRHRQNIADLVGTPRTSLAQSQERAMSPAFKIHEDGVNFITPLKPAGPYPEETASALQSAGLGKLFSPSKLTSLDDLPIPDLSVDEFLPAEFHNFFSQESPVPTKGLLSAKRPVHNRASASTSALADISNLVGNSSARSLRLGSPFSMPAPKRGVDHDLSGSPVKKKKRTAHAVAEPSPLKCPDIQVQVCDWSTSGSEDENSLQQDSGLDLSKGFQGIGASATRRTTAATVAAAARENKENQGVSMREKKQATFKTNKAARPVLGRSSTNVF